LTNSAKSSILFLVVNNHKTMSGETKKIPEDALMSKQEGTESVLKEDQIERGGISDNVQDISPEMMAKAREEAAAMEPGETSGQVSAQEALSSDSDWGSKNVEIGADIRAAAMELAAESESSAELRTSTIDAMMGQEVTFEVSDGLGAKGKITARNEDGSQVTIRVTTKKSWMPWKKDEIQDHTVNPDQIQGFDAMMQQNKNIQEMGTQSTG